jgi:hypothetical protein
MSTESTWIRTAVVAGATVVTAALVSSVVVNQQRSKSDTYVRVEADGGIGSFRRLCSFIDWLCPVASPHCPSLVPRPAQSHNDVAELADRVRGVAAGPEFRE